MILGPLARRVLAVAGTTTLAAAAGFAGAAPAQAAACSGTSGVTVVIQSSAGTSTRCASGDPSSALRALTATDHSFEFVRNQPGLVCRIDGYPSDACAGPPPLDAYWAFFHASSGGSWRYAQEGAGSYDPKPGSSVGFRFGSGSAPSVRPAAAPRPTTAAPRPTTAAPGPTTARPRGTTAARATAPPANRAAGTLTTVPTTAPRRAATAPASSGSAPVPSSPNGGSTAPARGAASASPSPSESPSPTPEALRAQDPSDTGAGSPGRLVGGGVLLLALASAVAAVALRRRAAGG